MTTVYTSLGLRNRPFSFSDGLASVFDYTPLSVNYHVSATPQIAVDLGAEGGAQCGDERGQTLDWLVV
jgi:hypothetical protein